MLSTAKSSRKSSNPETIYNFFFQKAFKEKAEIESWSLYKKKSQQM